MDDRNVVFQNIILMFFLGIGNKGVSKFYSANCTIEDAELVSEWMTAKKQEGFLTRTFKRECADKQGRTAYEIRLASIQTDAETGKYLIYKNE